MTTRFEDEDEEKWERTEVLEASFHHCMKRFVGEQLRVRFDGIREVEDEEELRVSHTSSKKCQTRKTIRERITTNEQR